MPAIPLRGDRSAWNAANYQSLHTNDIDGSASAIHHTLGTSASQAALGNHTHTTTAFSSGSSLTGQLFTSLGSGSATWLSLTNHSHSGSTSGDGGKLSWDNVWIDSVHDHSGSAQGGKLEATNLSSGAAVLGYVLSADGSGSTVWSLPPSSVSNLNNLSDVHTPVPNEGDVLTWSADSGSWIAYPPVDWRVTLIQDETTDDSDKTFTVPTITEWQILWIWVEYTSSSTEGTRQLEIQLQDSGSNVIAQFQTGVTQTKELTYKYLFGIGVPDLVTPRDGSNITTPLPAGTFLSEGQKLRVWDNNAVDTSGDDMVVRLQYASRTFRIPVYYVIPIHNSAHSQTADKVELVKSLYYMLTVRNTVQAQTSNNTILGWRMVTLAGMDATHLQTSGNITITYRDSLSINSSVHLHTPDNITSTQYNVLGIHSTTLRIVSNRVTLAVNVIHNPEAIGENSSHPQTAENVILTSYLPFLVDNCSQAQATSNFGLVTDIMVLGMKSSVQLQSSGKVSINNRFILTGIRNAVQSQTSTKVTGFTWHQRQLTVNNSSSRQTSQKIVLQNPSSRLYTIGTSTTLIDGQHYPYNSIAPGDVIELAPGTRGSITIKNIIGTAARPITIRNGNGVSNMIAVGASDWVGFYFQNCHYVHFTGNGYGQQYGIKVSEAKTFGILAEFKTDNIEIDHIEILKIIGNAIGIHLVTDRTYAPDYDYNGDGLINASDGIVNNSNYTIENVSIHDNHFNGIDATTLTAMYIGNSNTLGADWDYPRNRNLDIYNNLCENCDDKVIQCGAVESGLKIHDNIIINSCTSGWDDQEAINVNEGCTGGEVYNNWIQNINGDGIRFGGEGGKIYNNVIIDCGAVGYWDMGIVVNYRDGYSHSEDTQILNNTIINPLHWGIAVNTLGTITIQNNIIVQTGATYISGGDVVSNNLTTTNIATVGFIDVGGDDYHLGVGSSAINSGHNVSDYGVIDDFEGTPRPQEGTYDIGAYEYVITYYVDATSGNDANNGLSPSTPWKTMDRVNAFPFVPGNRILFKRGEHWYHQITPARNGSAGNPITYGAYGTGNRPIIHGNVVHMCALFVGETYHHLRFESIDFAGSNATNYGAALISGHDIYMYDCIFRDSQYMGFQGWTETGATLYNVTVDSCEAYNNYASGICITSNTATGGPHDCEVKYCVAHDNGNELIRYHDHGIYVRYGCIVHDCVSYNNAWGAGIKVNNEGIHTSWYPSVYNNTCYDNFIGIYAVNEYATIYNNLVYNNIIGVVMDPDSNYITFVFNTIVNSTPDSEACVFQINNAGSNNIIKNNLIIQDRTVSPYWVHRSNYVDTADFALNNSVDYNTYYTNGNSSTDIFRDSTGDRNWTEWKALAGSPDSHSTFLTSLPDVVARYTNMHPTDGGNIKNKGVAITGYDTDKDDNAREVPPTPGCYEEAAP